MGGRSTKSARRSNVTDLQAAKEELDSVYQQLEIMQEISKVDQEYVQSAESIVSPSTPLRILFRLCAPLCSLMPLC